MYMVVKIQANCLAYVCYTRVYVCVYQCRNNSVRLCIMHWKVFVIHVYIHMFHVKSCHALKILYNDVEASVSYLSCGTNLSVFLASCKKID